MRLAAQHEKEKAGIMLTFVILLGKLVSSKISVPATLEPAHPLLQVQISPYL
jgi:hypothetical protein